MSFLNNWINGNYASVCADETGYPIWDAWDANQRDLFVLDHEGNIVLYQNVTNGLPNNLESLIINLISEIPDCIDGEINNDNPCNPMECYNGEWSEMVIDCAEEMGIPCEGGIYIDPPEGVCCSTCVQYGDTNNDGALNVVDVVVMVNLVLDGIYNEVSDINTDGELNIVDIVSLVNLILNLGDSAMPEECFLEPDSGPCFGYMPMYYYNQDTQSCEIFIYGGCMGLVPFQSFEECYNACEEPTYSII